MLNKGIWPPEVENGPSVDSKKMRSQSYNCNEIANHMNDEETGSFLEYSEETQPPQTLLF